MRITHLIAILAIVFLLAGCAGMSRSEQNILGGGAIGAGLGAGIGAAAGGSPVAGALIGGAVGVVGGAIKDNMERRDSDYYRDREYYPPY